MLLHVFETVIVNLDVQLPVGVLLVDLFDDLVAELLVSPDHGESIAKSVESSSCISFDDSKR